MRCRCVKPLVWLPAFGYPRRFRPIRGGPRRLRRAWRWPIHSSRTSSHLWPRRSHAGILSAQAQQPRRGQPRGRCETVRVFLERNGRITKRGGGVSRIADPVGERSCCAARGELLSTTVKHHVEALSRGFRASTWPAARMRTQTRFNCCMEDIFDVAGDMAARLAARFGPAPTRQVSQLGSTGKVYGCISQNPAG